ncbi:precorrin-6A reductase [bacterium BMS3Bbin06]|nr:precorrin-6A reductase [bacterium BMS3Abin08]GBE34323.1 precorrin-6A reductase [bacterium BMS3Bbin06]HDO34969.1 precorrin-6A reductase [Nitrospirota bacterium]
MLKQGIAVLVITEEGLDIAAAIARTLKAELHVRRGINSRDLSGIESIEYDSLGRHVGTVFNSYRGLVFVMSLGIVNRVIAPLVKSKHEDPAVVTADEVGRYVISTLSGHEGGANELAYLVGSITGAEPVVTTATEAGREYICGVGCRRGEEGERIINAIRRGCELAGIKTGDLRCLASGWIKRDEEGLHYAVGQLGLYTRFIPAWLIEHYYQINPQAIRSDFVYAKTGVYGISEPSSLLAGRNTEQVLGKTCFDGVTVAISRERLFRNRDIGHISPAVIMDNEDLIKSIARSGSPVLILGGTTEAMRVGRAVRRQTEDFFISTATEYGYELFMEEFGERVIKGRFSEETLKEFISGKGITTIIDCTHPYAEVITELAGKVSAASGTGYVSMVRNTGPGDIDYERGIRVGSVREAAEKIKETGLATPFFTTGSKDLDFIEVLEGRDVFVRVLPFEESIKRCVEKGINRKNIIAMQGPFSRELDIALIKQYGFDVIVTKNTGREGGFFEKVKAAEICGIWVVIVG